MRPIPSLPGYFADEQGQIWNDVRRVLSERRVAAHRLHGEGKTGDAIAKLLGVSRAQAYNYLNSSGRTVAPVKLSVVKKTKYLSLSVHREGKVRLFLAHRLVLEAFVGPCPPGLETRHLNGDRQDNRPANLAWGTRSENMRDKRVHGTEPRGSAHPNATMTEETARSIREMRMKGTHTIKEVAALFGVSPSAAYWVLQGKTWAHAGGPNASTVRLSAAGERSGKAKLNVVQVKEIRALAANGVRITDIARLYDLETTNVSAIVTRRSWRSV